MNRGVLFRLLLGEPGEIERFLKYDFALHLTVGGGRES
jgi:hypothetical protein